MDYFKINLMPRHDPEFCFLRDYPEGVELNRYKFGKGEAFGDDYPDDPRIYMNKKERGLKLPSVVGNTRSMLIVHRDVKKIIEKNDPGPIEFLPLHIYNHKKRLASDEFFVVNPLGTWDCLDLDASEIDYLDGKVADVLELVLDRKKLEKAPDLFRVKEDPSVYVASRRLLEKIVGGKVKVTNLYIDPLPVAGE